MMKNKMKVLLTGGTGFIGTKFVEKFSKEFNLIIFSSKEKIQEQKIIKTIEKINPDVIIHLAALSGLKNCELNQKKAFDVNVIGTENIVKGCIKNNSRLIFLSSREVYGLTGMKKSDENDKLEPISVYGQTKMKAEKIIQKYGIKENLDYTILRVSNVYGPGSKSGINRLIIDALNKKKIIINGGEQILNLIFINDVIQILYLILKNNKISKEIFNIGSENTISLNEFIKILIKLLDQNIEIQIDEKPSFESSYFDPNITKQNKILEYDSKTTLNNAINITINHIKKNLV
jgi:UDP-glucose 4-epimerase